MSREFTGQKFKFTVTLETRASSFSPEISDKSILTLSLSYGSFRTHFLRKFCILAGRHKFIKKVIESWESHKKS